MSDYYCDHGAYAAYSATPTWGTPQEGDGLASSASTASSTVAIDLTSAVFTSGSSTVSVMGATALTVSASANSATNIQYSATLATMIDNIVTVINTLATAAIVNKPAGWKAPQIRNAVFARRTGTSLEIMTRAGSASWNGLVAIAFANVTNASSGSWANGTSGCWGYLFNHLSTIWASAVGIAGYGIWASELPYAGAISPGDVINIRSNKTLTLATNANVTWAMAGMGSAAAPVLFEIDDGTIWPVDGTSPVLKITESFISNNAMIWYATSATFAHIKAKKYASGQRSLVLEALATGTTLAHIRVYGGAVPLIFEFVDFSCPGTPASSTATSSVYTEAGSSSTVSTTFIGCRWIWPGNNSNVQFVSAVHNGSLRMAFTGCEFKQTAPVSAQNYVFGLLNGGTAPRIDFESCIFSGFVAGSRLTLGGVQLLGGTSLAFRNCDFGNVSVRGPNFCTAVSGGHTADMCTASTKLGDRDFFVESRSGFCEWNSKRGFPLLNAKLMDGLTGWSIYAVATTVSGNISRVQPFELPEICKVNSLSSGNRTITVNLLTESTLGWTLADISCVLTYVNSSGEQVVINTHDMSGGALTTSSSTWSSFAFNGQTWLSKSFSFAANDLASGAEVSAFIRLHSPVANDTLGVFVDPELVIT